MTHSPSNRTHTIPLLGLTPSGKTIKDGGRPFHNRQSRTSSKLQKVCQYGEGALPKDIMVILLLSMTTFRLGLGLWGAANGSLLAQEFLYGRIESDRIFDVGDVSGTGDEHIPGTGNSLMDPPMISGGAPASSAPTSINVGTLTSLRRTP